MPDKYIEEARELLEPFCHFADGIEWCTNPSPDELREAIASALRSRDEQHRRESEEHRKSQVIVELYNDGWWWCINGPRCVDGFAPCSGHHSFQGWFEAVKENVELVQNYRASQLGSKEEKGG